MIADPSEMTAAEMDRWVSEFDSWDVCDQVCMNLFEERRLQGRKSGSGRAVRKSLSGAPRMR